MPTATIASPKAGTFKVWYAYTLEDGSGELLPSHATRVKVGDATLHTEMDLPELLASCEEQDGLYTSNLVREAAGRRIDDQTKTADISFRLLAAYLAVRPGENGKWEAYRDYSLHDVLVRSGTKRKHVRRDKKTGEWFETEVATVEAAARALNVGRSSIGLASSNRSVVLRPEQKEAVRKTKRVFKNGTYEEPKDFLWNAIMRFGKTLTTYKLVEELQDDVKKVLVLTHRPVVVEGWGEDFYSIFGNTDWTFASKKRDETWDAIKDKEKFFYFASVQDLRGSFDLSNEHNEDDGQDEEWSEQELAQVFTKNAEIFATDFDLIVLDEAHEGLKTELADRMFAALKTRYTLRLSGTPFNLVEDFDADQIYTWSYTDEQRAKREWNDAQSDPEDPRYLEPNPYSALPELEIRTIDLSKVFEKYPEVQADSTYFKLNRFFAVDKTRTVKSEIYGEVHPFKNEAMVRRLLSLMTDTRQGDLDPLTGEVKNVEPSSFPFANDGASIDFADSFWLLPSIDATRSLHELLSLHPYFSTFRIVNASGNNDSGDPLADVQAAIGEADRTITLSIGKLTTGTTVKEWTSVLMMSNMRSAMSYMQTIFRSKSSGSLRDGRAKEKAFVFDFDPDRTLEMVVEAGRKNAIAKIREEKLKLSVVDEDELERSQIDELLTYLPIIAYDGVEFKQADSSFIMETVNRLAIDATVKGGFESLKLYNREALNEVTLEDLSLFSDLALSVSKSTTDPAVRKVKISKSALSDGVKSTIRTDPSLFPELDSQAKRGAELTEEQAAMLKEYKDHMANRKQMMLTLRGVSVRLPLLILGAEPVGSVGGSNRITIENFPDQIDDESWREFMPKGFEKKGLDRPSWESLSKYYNREVFEGSANAIQAKINEIFQLPVLERALPIAHFFSTVKNPDKETILTSWKVVNLQYANTLGGLRWVNDAGDCRMRNLRTGEIEYLPIEDALDSDTIHAREGYEAAPEWVTSDVDPVEADGRDFWEDPETTILDINSKTCLYPFYAALSRFYAERELRKAAKYRGRRVKSEYEDFAEDEQHLEDLRCWKRIVEKDIFVNARVPYSARIARRVLAGYDERIQVNATVIDVLQVRSVIEAAKVAKTETKQRVLTLEEKVSLWRWIFNPEAMSTVREDGKTLSEERRDRIVIEDVSKLLEELEITKNSGRFTAIVANPPYQMTLSAASSDANQGKEMKVYPQFFMVSTYISDLACIIFPDGWRFSSGKGTLYEGPSMRSDKQIYSIIPLGQKAFPEVGISVDVVLWKKDYDNRGEMEKFYTSAPEAWLKLSKLYPSIEKKIGSQRANRIEGDGELVSRVKGYPDFIFDEPGPDRIAIHHSKGRVYYCSTSHPIFKPLQKVKLIFPMTGTQRSYRDSLIIDSHEEYSNYWIPVFFDSREEAQNFRSYLGTLFYRGLLAMGTVSQNATRSTHRFVPDLSNVCNPRTKKVGWNSDWTDDDLKELFKEVLTDEDWAYIEKTAIESDPAGLRRSSEQSRNR